MKTGIVDTHVLVWYLEGKKNLKPAIVEFMDSELNRLVIPTIVLCELKYLIERKRLGLSYEKLFNHLWRDPRIEICPMDLDVVHKIPVQLDIHDAIITATYLKIDGENEPNHTFLLTQDKTICKSGLARTL